MVHRAPLVEGNVNNEPVAREIGYRSMQIFQGESTIRSPALYVAAWAPPAALLAGMSFGPMMAAPSSAFRATGILEQRVAATRSLTAFAGRFFFSPTARRGTDGGQQNTAGLPLVYETRDVAGEKWVEVSEPGFGDAGTLGFFR